MEQLSVVVCTYNPIDMAFSKCLQAIKQANDVCKAREIIIVDNNSKEPVSKKEYVKAFVDAVPQAKVIVEKQQGLTPARLRGIKEASGDIIVFIDDDNWIVPDFFLAGTEIAMRCPHIGSWSGQVKLEFETQPEQWTKKYWGLLVYREFDHDMWSNLPHLTDTIPCGAGLFVRKQVAAYYHALHESGKRNIQLDRSGGSLLSAGDNDLAACACDIGLGVGLFHALQLTHYIPRFRLSREYLLKLAEDIHASAVILKAFRNVPPKHGSLKKEVIHLVRLLAAGNIERSFLKAIKRGEKKGKSLLEGFLPET